MDYISESWYNDSVKASKADDISAFRQLIGALKRAGAGTSSSTFSIRASEKHSTGERGSFSVETVTFEQRDTSVELMVITGATSPKSRLHQWTFESAERLWKKRQSLIATTNGRERIGR